MLRMLLLAGPRKLPDVDFMYTSSDNDPTPTFGREGSGAPVLSNSHEPGRASVGWPDYSWVGWDTHTLPWCELFTRQSAPGIHVPWVQKKDAAIFAGNMNNGAGALADESVHLRPAATIARPPPQAVCHTVVRSTAAAAPLATPLSEERQYRRVHASTAVVPRQPACVYLLAARDLLFQVCSLATGDRLCQSCAAHGFGAPYAPLRMISRSAGACRRKRSTPCFCTPCASHAEVVAAFDAPVDDAGRIEAAHAMQLDGDSPAAHVR